MEENKQEDFEQLALEDVAYGNQHALNILLDLLIEKGILSEQEFKDKLDAMIEECEDDDEAAEQVAVQGPDTTEN